jgi:hypothetical protein
MSDRLFTGREQELQRFKAMLQGQDSTRVLAITGMGGIGKTELLRQFQWLAERCGVCWALIDETLGEDVPRILSAIHRQLSAAGIELERLGKSLDEYARILARLPSPARAIVGSVGETVGSSTKAIPFVPSVIAEATQQIAGDGRRS